MEKKLNDFNIISSNLHKFLYKNSLKLEKNGENSLLIPLSNHRRNLC